MSINLMKGVLKSFENENSSDLNDTKQNISKLSAEILKNKQKTQLHIEKNFNNLFSNTNDNEILINEGKNIIEEVKDLLKLVENETKPQLELSDNEINQFREELNEIFYGLKTTEKLLKIDELFEHFEEAKNNENTLLLMEIIGKLKSLIFDGNDKILPRLLCYQNIKLKYYTESELLLYNLNQQFEELIKLNETCTKNTKEVTIKISKDENKLKNIIIGLFNAKYNPTKICSFLLNNVFEKIVKTSVSLNIIEDDNSSEYIELLLSYNLNDNEENLTKPNYKIIFENILIVLNYLNYINIKISDNICVFDIFGKCLNMKFSELLINKCLVYYISDVSDEMRDSILIKDILKFNKSLIDLHLFNGDCDKELIKFVDNVIMLSKNRFHKKCIDEALIIMKKDLYNMISSQENINNLKLQNQKYDFPNCMISKSILELVMLLNKIIKEEDEQNFGVISSITNQYISEVPKYHEKMLYNIPQQTALFFNNTMYFSNWLLSNFHDDNLEVQNLFQSLQNLASEYFAKQVETQYNQLNSILIDLDLSDAISEVGVGQQKIIRQCLRQFDLLKNVWHTILPEDLYNNTMLGLIDEFCKELIQNIMIIEDIPSLVSNELAEIINLIEERIPRLFQEKGQIVQAKLWLKLIQLKMILGSSLIEISELWSDGVGPLSLNFKAEEIKHLIRALFQNTERRANILALIT